MYHGNEHTHCVNEIIQTPLIWHGISQVEFLIAVWKEKCWKPGVDDQVQQLQSWEEEHSLPVSPVLVFSAVSSEEQWKTIEMPINKTIRANILEIISPTLFYAIPNEMPGKTLKLDTRLCYCSTLCKEHACLEFLRKWRGEEESDGFYVTCYLKEWWIIIPEAHGVITTQMGLDGTLCVPHSEQFGLENHQQLYVTR